MRLNSYFKFYALTLFYVLILCAQLQAQKIGFLMDSYVTERWARDQKYFIEKVESLGGSVQVEIAYGDPQEQLRLGKKLIADGVKALVVIATDAAKAVEIVNVAKKAKVPVICYDRLILSKDLAMYVSYSGERVGELQAQYALNKVPQGNYIILSGPVSDNNAYQFKKGQMKILKPYIDNGTVKLIGDFQMGDWGEIGALVQVDNFLSSSKVKPDVIIAANDALASGAIQALPADALGKVVITGQDADVTAIKYILSGSQSMTIYKPIKPLAYLAAETAVKIATRKEVKGKIRFKSGNIEVDAILLDPISVDKTNYNETVIKDGHVQLSKLEDKK